MEMSYIFLSKLLKHTVYLVKWVKFFINGSCNVYYSNLFSDRGPQSWNVERDRYVKETGYYLGITENKKVNVTDQ